MLCCHRMRRPTRDEGCTCRPGSWSGKQLRRHPRATWAVGWGHGLGVEAEEPRRARAPRVRCPVLSPFQLGANALLFLSVNTYGVFVRVLAERSQSKAFLQARSYTEDRLRLEDENEKQVGAGGSHLQGHGASGGHGVGSTAGGMGPGGGCRQRSVGPGCRAGSTQRGARSSGWRCSGASGRGDRATAVGTP